jgi:hypothetical protein
MIHNQNSWHLNPNDTIQQILNGPYWWSTIAQDTNHYNNEECSKCKKKNNN